jgi:hypothetical protein
LLNTAKDTVKRQTYGGHDLVSAYLTGSLIYDQPLLGGITDIDLIYIHSVDIPCRREIVPITEEIHLDIAHYPQSLFSQPRELRSDAWVGSFLCHDPIMLYDTSHWFEYTQAGVAAQFFLPSNIIQRVKFFSDRARSSWLQLQMKSGDFTPETRLEFLRILKDAANAISCLTSVPLTERRFLVDFPERARSLNMPGLAGGFVDLILPVEPVETDWENWLENWKTSFNELLKNTDVPLGLSKGRLPYYEKAIIDLQSSHQEAALWVMLWTWTLIANLLPQKSSAVSAYEHFCSLMALDRGNFKERLSALDIYLDTVEETIDNWSYQNGI